jgi:hypothetical protein
VRRRHEDYILEAAHRWASLRRPDLPRGVTDASLYQYYVLHDELRAYAAVVRGRPHPDCWGVVEVADRRGKVLARFYGFAWGYGGEGPTGLAAMLADLGLFRDMDEAVDYVIRLPQDEPWAMVRRDVAGV